MIELPQCSIIKIMKKISVVIPVYNEEETLQEFFKRISEVCPTLNYETEVIFVDDGSKDTSLQILTAAQKQYSNFKVLSFSRNFGHQPAITAGMNYATGDAVIVMDGDLQDPPEFITTLVEHWEKGFDVVYAKRAKRKGENLFKLVTANLFYRVFDRLTEIKMPLDTGDFRLIDRKVLAVYKNLQEKNPFIRGLITWIGFKQIGVDYIRDIRYAGKTKFSLIKMLKFAFDGIISFSNKPLKLAIQAGTLTILLAILLTIYYLYIKIVDPTQLVQGWLSLFIAILFFSGVQLFTIGIIGEYISRIYDEVKGRPKYIVAETLGFNDIEA